MNNLTKMIAVLSFTAALIACKKDEDPIVTVPPSDGSTLTLNGILGAEAGTAAGNAVYVDFSKDQQTPVDRASWDLGFYSGTDFRVVLNNTASAGAKVLNETSLAAVGTAQTAGLTLAVNQMAPANTDFAYFDALNGSVTSTVIPAVPATASESKVIILNRGTGGSIAARPWIKLKVTRNTSGGYTLQYAEINETTNFKTVDVPKDGKFNFKFVSLNGNGSIVNVEPEKAAWDIVWGYSVYQTTSDGALVPYNFSDLVFINTLGGVQAGEVLTSTVTYANYGEANIAATVFSSNRDVIGSNWRVTSGGTVGVKTDRFYAVKDGAGNVYKLKFNSFHANDGGVRGKPVIEYKLVKKG